MWTGFLTALAVASVLTLALWLAPKLWRIACALVVLLAPYGVVRTIQVTRGVARRYREEMENERTEE